MYKAVEEFGEYLISELNKVKKHLLKKDISIEKILIGNFSGSEFNKDDVDWYLEIYFKNEYLKDINNEYMTLYIEYINKDNHFLLKGCMYYKNEDIEEDSFYLKIENTTLDNAKSIYAKYFADKFYIDYNTLKQKIVKS